MATCIVWEGFKLFESLNIDHPRVVGIGASAGGLEALENFFKNVPDRSKLAYVVIQHLSPDFKSLMNELLARHTLLEIKKMDEAVSIKPNTIYLIPPKKNLTIKGNKLIPSDQDPTLQLKLPIDHFFISLAKERGADAIGVILSGTGCDGTRGCGAIKEADGFVVVQDSASCQFDGMPYSVIKQGLQDAVMPPDKMPEIIQNYVYGEAEKESSFEASKLKTILDMLQRVENLDFSNYRPSTVVRRIQRRIKVSQTPSIESYVGLLKDDQEELRTLHSELLINVTRFFRDKKEFEYLKEAALPKIVDKAIAEGRTKIRIWVAGCSTGEEAFSIAICLQEYLDSKDLSLSFKIFATDVDREAIVFAAKGCYPKSIVSDIETRLAEKYFVEKDDSYEVRSKLRRSIIFSHHNVTQDPPFTKIDLTSCRNMLIYFQTSLQAKVLALFHFSLEDKGILFLGKSESLGKLSGEFTLLNAAHRFFEKIRNVRLALATDLNALQPLKSNILPKAQALPPRGLYAAKTTGGKENQLVQVYEKLLNRYVPPCILVDENHEIVHVFGNASRFLDFPVGRITLNIMKVLDKELSLALSAALLRAADKDEPVFFTDIKSAKNPEKTFNLSVEPFAFAQPRRTKTFMLIFEEAEKTIAEPIAKSEKYSSSSHSFEQISNLENQLQSTKETLQATIEELETTNEELQSTNEELMSSNEELQSSNEELHSVNEELYTVNTEHQSKMEEITQANKDIDFLLSNSNIAIMFLDESLQIKRFNKEILSMISVMDHDVGRSISDLTFSVANEEIMKSILLVSKTGNAKVLNIVKGGAEYLVKAIPYNYSSTTKDASSEYGVVLSFMETPS